MEFERLRVKEIRLVVRFASHQKRWTAMRRSDHIMGIQLRGEAIHRFADRSITLTDHCVFFLNQKDDYSVEVLSPPEACAVHFTTYEPIDTESFCLPVKEKGEFLRIFEKMERQILSDPSDELTAMGLLYRFTALVTDLREKGYSPKDPRMLRAKAVIDQSFREGDCVERAVAETGLSRRRFNDLFRQSFDVTPVRYLTHKRMEYAKQLLSTGNFSVSHIAEMCGYGDIYYFSKVFKTETGLSPLQWKGKN